MNYKSQKDIDAYLVRLGVQKAPLATPVSAQHAIERLSNIDWDRIGERIARQIDEDILRSIIEQTRVGAFSVGDNE